MALWLTALETGLSMRRLPWTPAQACAIMAICCDWKLCAQSTSSTFVGRHLQHFFLPKVRAAAGQGHEDP